MMNIRNYPRLHQFPFYEPDSIPYYKTNLDLIENNKVVCLIDGDVAQFILDCPESKELVEGSWDGQILVKLIYPDVKGANGIERIRNAPK